MLTIFIARRCYGFVFFQIYNVSARKLTYVIVSSSYFKRKHELVKIVDLQRANDLLSLNVIMRENTQD